MTRDEARAIWAASSLTYASLNTDRLRALRDMINAEMIASNLMPSGPCGVGSFRMHSSFKAKVGALRIEAYLQCRSYYFRDREAVSFNGNGFIGFAGWADEENVQPILRGFCTWVRWMFANNAPAPCPFEVVAYWHEKQARTFSEMASDIRVGEIGRAKADEAARHHAGSAAALRIKAADIHRERARAILGTGGMEGSNADP